MPAASVQLNGFVPASVGGRSASASQAPSFFARVLNAVHVAQTKRAEREIARFIEARGGRMTDDLERKIERHFV